MSSSCSFADELLEVAPNDEELLHGFGIRNATHRKKIVNWMLLVLTRKTAGEESPWDKYIGKDGQATPRHNFQRCRSGNGGAAVTMAREQAKTKKKPEIKTPRGEVPRKRTVVVDIDTFAERKLTTSVVEEQVYREQLKIVDRDKGRPFTSHTGPHHISHNWALPQNIHL